MPNVNYSREQYDDPAENTTEDFHQCLDNFLHSHEDPHYDNFNSPYYDQETYTHIVEYDDENPPSNADFIYDHDNKEDSYPPHNNDYGYPDNGSHHYYTLDNINELDKNEYLRNGHYYPNDAYQGYPTPDDDEPHFPSINSDQYWTPDEFPETTYHTANDEPYENLEDYCCVYCTGQYPNNWCPTPHYL
jgi:hypothetical protein